MNLSELCTKYNVAESSVITAFPRTQKSIYKNHGVYITRIKKDNEVIYLEQKDEEYRGITLYEELKDVRLISMDILRDTNWEYICFLSLVITPNLSFRGKYKDYLREANIKYTEIHLKKMKEGFQKLKERGIIFYEEESVDNEYFIIGLKRSAEIHMKIGLEMFFTCKALAKMNEKRKALSCLIKVWIGTQLLYDIPYTMTSFSNATGISVATLKRYQVGILETSNVFRSSIGYNNFKKYLYPYTFDKN